MTHSIFRFKFIAPAVLCSLLFSFVFIACNNDEPAPTPVDKTALEDSIAVGNNLIATTVEGTKPGEYTVGSQATLQTAIDAAQAVDDNVDATDADVTNATANLHAALDAYRASKNQEIAAENLIGYWKMNGNANDSSGHNNNGTVTQGPAFFGAGTPNLTANRFGQANMAYHFDHGGNIDVPYSSALNPPQMSISLWARQDTAGRTINKNSSYMVSMNRWNGYKFQTQEVYKPFFTVKAINGADTVYYDRDDVTFVLEPGATWYHLVVTFTSGVMDFYVDGTLVKEWTNVPGTPIAINNIDLTIGSDLPTNVYTTTDDGTGRFFVEYGGFWTGDLDDVMFYNVALTGPQVASIYANQLTP